MDSFLDSLQKLSEMSATIAQSQFAVAKHPEDLGLKLTIESLYKRQQKLERDFLAAARVEQRDVCNYRLYSGNTFFSV